MQRLQFEVIKVDEHTIYKITNLLKDNLLFLANSGVLDDSQDSKEKVPLFFEKKNAEKNERLYYYVFPHSEKEFADEEEPKNILKKYLISNYPPRAELEKSDNISKEAEQRLEDDGSGYINLDNTDLHAEIALKSYLAFKSELHSELDIKKKRDSVIVSTAPEITTQNSHGLFSKQPDKAPDSTTPLESQPLLRRPEGPLSPTESFRCCTLI